MKCMYCKGEMEKGAAPFHIDRKGVHISLDDIPAWVCSQCGESYFEETEVNSMQALVKIVEKNHTDLQRQHGKVEQSAYFGSPSPLSSSGDRLAQ